MQKESAREGIKPPQVLSNYLRGSRNSYCQRTIDCIAIGFSAYYFNQTLSHSELSLSFDVVVIAVATIDFFYSFSHNFEEFRNLLNNKVNYNIYCKKLFSK